MHNIMPAIYGLNSLEKSMLSIIPETVIILFAFIVLFLTFSEKTAKSKNSYYISLLGIAFSIVYVFMLAGRNLTGFYGSVTFNGYDVFIFTAILISGFLTVLMSGDYIENFDMPYPEYYSIILFGISAMMFLASSNNLIMVFISLEFMSICAYILTGYIRGNTRSTEAALKYLILGTFASAFLIFGSVFIYAAAGHLNLNSIHSYLESISYVKQGGAAVSSSRGIIEYLIVGLLLFMVGLAFKMSLFPFHSWTPDAYDGAPTPITSFMATGIKLAAFAIFLRIYLLIYNFNIINFNDILWILAVLSMTFGNIAAILSVNVKRLLAYSSIAQAGYILVGIIGGGFYGYSGTLFYLLAYIFMTAGAFAVVIIFENSNLISLDIKKYSGLGYKHPFISAAMALFMLSLAGIPVTAGFMGKFYVFSAAIKSGYYWLVFIALLNSAFAAFYYIKIIVKMYMPESKDSAVSTEADGGANYGIIKGSISEGLLAAVIICLFFTLLMGIYPQIFINFANYSAVSLCKI